MKRLLKMLWKEYKIHLIIVFFVLLLMRMQRFKEHYLCKL